MKTTLPSFKSVFLNWKTLSFFLFVGLSITALWLSQLMNQEVQEASNQDPAILALQEARQGLDEKLVQINKERGSIDANPEGPANPGTMQALYASWSVEIRTRVTKMIGDRESRWYNHAPWQIYQSMREDTIAMIVAAETAQKTTLTYVDPRTGKEIAIRLDPETLMLQGTAKLMAIDLAEHGGRQQKAKLSDLRSDIARQELDKKIETARVFEAEGKTAVAAEMLKRDVYGGEVRPEKVIYDNKAQKELEGLKQHFNQVMGTPHN